MNREASISVRDSRCRPGVTTIAGVGAGAPLPQRAASRDAVTGSSNSLLLSSRSSIQSA